MDVKEMVYDNLASAFSKDRVSYFYPKSFKELPAVSYYEISQRPFSFADDEAYLIESLIEVSVFSASSAVLFCMGALADETMKKAGFVRVEVKESYDKENLIYKRTHIYKILIGG